MLEVRQKKILFLFGTRPEAIKLAPVIKYFLKDGTFEVTCCSTGQHNEMLQQVISFFQLQVDINLNVMRTNQSLAGLTAEIIRNLEPILNSYSPDLVMVHGDTTTSFCGALTSFYNNIPVGHVEAGLRTNSKCSPFPEEMNRTFNGYVSSLHFAPTPGAVENLAKENIKDNVFLTGNTVIDALNLGLSNLENTGYAPSWAESVDISKRVILVTQHRRENFGDGILSILKALSSLSKRNDVQIIFPVHLNPKVRLEVHKMLADHSNILLLDPIPYPDLLWCLKNCYFIITDSGGIQEEAPSLGKPFLITRETTERPEAIDCGAGFLVGTDTKRILEYSEKLLEDFAFYAAFKNVKNPYGDGWASKRILDAVKDFGFK